MPKLRPGSVLQEKLVKRSSAKRIVTSFAEEHGLVYFGYVSQRSDDHHIVRGMTVSTKHHDDHYCIGTYDGYDVVFVERTDTLQNGRRHQWHILEFDLKTRRDIPHAFIGSDKSTNGFHELLSIKYPAMQPSQPSLTASYPAGFLNNFTLYCTPAHAIELEHVITPDIAQVIGSHFGGLVLEVANDSLFVYSESGHLTPALLATMLKNGTWLATQIDEKSSPVSDDL